MPTITNADVEAEARALLRARIARLPWHADLPPEERERRIDADVELFWPTMTAAAVKCLLDRVDGTDQ